MKGRAALATLTTLVAALWLAGCTPPAAPQGAVAHPVDAADLVPGVTVSKDLQQRLGLEFATVSAGSLQAVASGTATVLDGESFGAAFEEVTAARTDLAAQRESAERLLRLYADDGNASLQALEAARSQAAAARARLSTVEAKARAEWGVRLMDARDAQAAQLRAQLSAGRAMLLRAEFSGVLPTNAGTLKYALESVAQGEEQQLEAKFIERSRSPTLTANGAAVTLSVVSSSNASLPRPGSRVVVMASSPDGPTRPLVPAAATIADAGQLWFYVARADDRFERQVLAPEQRVGESYPSDGVKPGDRVVVRGAPLLLSLERGAGAAAADEE